MRWWFNRVPKYKGITRGVLNNWWHYFIDYQQAVELESQTPVVSVGDGQSFLLPNEFELEQNYPNPFNPSTSISFILKNAGKVKLEIYDSLGQHVDTIINTTLGAGSHVTNWKPNAASGVYFCRLTFNSENNSRQNYSDVIKMMYLK